MAAAEPVPVFTNLSDVYDGPGGTLPHAERWNSLVEEFVKRFGRRPAYIARAPGRVNLIGEHIDYALFGVLPAAIDRDVLIACAPRSGQHAGASADRGHVVADNVASKYERREFAPLPVPRDPGVPDDEAHVEGWHIDIDTQTLQWESYVKAGYYGVLNRFFTAPLSEGHPVPVDLLVAGTVPAGSGLSSSAAMVVASTLAFLAVNGKLDAQRAPGALTKGALVRMAVENETRVGVHSGGMDQAAAVVARPGAALHIAFFPRLAAERVPLPRAAFVCAHSRVVADKLVGARTRYNLRVVETLVAARVLARRLGVALDRGGARERVTLREVVGRLVGQEDADGMDAAVLEHALERMGREVELLKPERQDGELGVTLEEMIQWSGLSAADFHELYLSWVDVEATHFQLYKRAKHVFSEALRVLRFRALCLRAAAASGPAAHARTLRALGRLMDASHESCARAFECSCPALDALAGLARRAGALGSRLTGAGWGGCIVSLVEEGNVEPFIAYLRRNYAPYRTLGDEALREVVFATTPGSGACVFKFEE